MRISSLSVLLKFSSLVFYVNRRWNYEGWFGMLLIMRRLTSTSLPIFKISLLSLIILNEQQRQSSLRCSMKIVQVIENSSFDWTTYCSPVIYVYWTIGGKTKSVKISTVLYISSRLWIAKSVLIWSIQDYTRYQIDTSQNTDHWVTSTNQHPIIVIDHKMTPIPQKICLDLVFYIHTYMDKRNADDPKIRRAYLAVQRTQDNDKRSFWFFMPKYILKFS